MHVTGLLARDGLAPDVRILIATAVATWRANWQDVTAWVEVARQRGHQRQDLEETLLQCVLFCGFPRAITAFEHFANGWPVQPPPSGGGLPDGDRTPAGKELFRSIYGKNDAAVRSMLLGYHQELHDFVLEAAYGRILTRPQLTAKKRELVAVAVLAAQGQVRQFAGHARGAKNFGATTEEIREALVTTFGVEDASADDIESWMSLVR